MLGFKCFHNTGTVVTIIRSADGWRTRIDLKEVGQDDLVTITCKSQPTLDKAQYYAEMELLKYGHVCNLDCDGWEEFVSAVG